MECKDCGDNGVEYSNPAPVPPPNTTVIWNEREWINDEPDEPALFAHYERVPFSKRPLCTVLPWAHMSGAEEA